MRILLSRTDRVGDLILTTPTITTIRRRFPDAHITMVCSRYNSIVMDRNPDVDSIVKLPSEIEPEVFGRRFIGKVDLAIALAPRATDIRVVGATRAPRRVGYTYVRRYLMRLTARRWLTDLLISEADPEGSDRDPSLTVRHEVDQVLALARAVGAQELSHTLVVPVGPAERANAERLPLGSITVQLGKRWMENGSTIASTLELLRELRTLGRPIVATYADDGRPLALAVSDAGLADRVIGELGFLDWAAALERAAVVVTVDTGATHVASAMGRPTVVLFEYKYFRLNSQEWSPYRVPNAVLRKPRTDAPDALAASRAEIVDAVRSLL